MNTGLRSVNFHARNTKLCHLSNYTPDSHLYILYCFFLSVMLLKDIALFSYIYHTKKPSFNDKV